MVQVASRFDRWLKVDILETDVCEALTRRLWSLYGSGELWKDEQCPSSMSLRNDRVLDSVLEQLVPFMEDRTGLRVSPTYCYARIYMPGEILHKHTDRPACEISITVTLGYKGELWPIFVDGEKLLLPVGSGAIYRGCQVPHWRDEYVEGEWQTQAFFHYVDANGPYKHHRYDKRSKLAHH
jgi:hypothetical protein